MQLVVGMLLGCFLLWCIDARAEVPPDRCPGVGGTLVGIQRDSISLKFNDKTTVMPIAPGAEIWRRGVDLESIHQLVLGDDIYLKCSQAPGSGKGMASLLVAVETGDAVLMEPHHVAEYRVCKGN